MNSRANLFCAYIFLRRCDILYRDIGFQLPLEHLIAFLQAKENLKFLKEKLRAKTFLYMNDNWATEPHEWLLRSSTLSALKRKQIIKNILLLIQPQRYKLILALRSNDPVFTRGFNKNPQLIYEQSLTMMYLQILTV